MKTLQELINENTITMQSFNTEEIKKQFDMLKPIPNKYKLIINLSNEVTQYWHETSMLFIDLGYYKFPDTNGGVYLILQNKLPNDVYYSMQNKSLIIYDTNIDDFETYKDELKKIFNLTNAEVIKDLTSNFNDNVFIENFKRTQICSFIDYLDNYKI